MADADAIVTDAPSRSRAVSASAWSITTFTAMAAPTATFGPPASPSPDDQLRRVRIARISIVPVALIAVPVPTRAVVSERTTATATAGLTAVSPDAPAWTF